MSSRKRLLSIELPDHDRLNEELGGGIPTGNIVLIEGSYGAGKSVLSQRFSYGFCENEASVTYLSTEVTVSGFLDRMNSLSYDIVSHLLDKRLLFLHGDLDNVRQKAGGGRQTERVDLLSRLMDAEEMWQADVIIIDTFDAILRNDPQFEALVRDNEKRQAALEIISFFRDVISQGKVIVLTVDPTTLNDEALGPFRAITDVLLELQMIDVGNDVRRQISVKRFAGMGEQVGAVIGYSIRPGSGIVIEKRSVA